MNQKKFVIRVDIETFEFLQKNAAINLTSINKLINEIIQEYVKDAEKVISSRNFDILDTRSRFKSYKSTT
ncbi:MAG: hypothetical protein EOL98_09380 [Negativicutes bacterium]|nr:hypothetical protein [Negativicutes bacterium]